LYIHLAFSYLFNKLIISLASVIFKSLAMISLPKKRLAIDAIVISTITTKVFNTYVGYGKYPFISFLINALMGDAVNNLGL